MSVLPEILLDYLETMSPSSTSHQTLLHSVLGAFSDNETVREYARDQLKLRKDEPDPVYPTHRSKLAEVKDMLGVKSVRGSYEENFSFDRKSRQLWIPEERLEFSSSFELAALAVPYIKRKKRGKLKMYRKIADK